MSATQTNYFTRRAATQLEFAERARSGAIARVHRQLSDMYLEKARTLGEGDLLDR